MRTLEVLNAFVSLLASHVVFQGDFFVLCSLPLWNAVLVPYPPPTHTHLPAARPTLIIASFLLGSVLWLCV